ncbi:MAG: DNA helicase II / ATP-dependent DNA helicase PcrA [Parcubacteria group bacterium Gr01-1014_18]|nr:MAG: DNA helicase II / ATP-dependent DNA helicase PcrA [Parcubacteria group bacterium Greene0416_36]TSC80943.1 MAG: DNA helicase II / ATP-dependent DNA helicase PcrA [Parcubacteria group bacterium Gr01-1014_18]TSC98714.1 MAG: DNA helicase II / ATP-dependent DNA helicase PcrA [Parcubacteria group bacterium Greene1014_20]TSD06466.1 MAG: DNA helicase II / ATP-dependent DNA helicase PcrA [Parcubacteria group bacterium Greene0714_2]
MINYRTELNSEQYEVIEKGGGYSLVLAGAGSGKTRTLVYRVAYLLEHGIAPENILLLTFTNKAAREMMERLYELLAGRSDVRITGIWGGTFHSMANRILRRYAGAIGFSNSFAILDEDDSEDLLKESLKSVVPEADKSFPKTRVIRSMISFAKNKGVSVSELLAEKYAHIPDEVASQIRQIAGLYEEKKKKASSMDFDDLLYYWNLLLDDPRIRQELGGQFKYILVDEYQDTNYIQSSIVRKLSSVANNLLVVGDDAQSIYSFRAATISNILGFPKDFTPSQVFRIETNYRSVAGILNLASASIARNIKQHKKTLKSAREGGDKPNLVYVRNNLEQSSWVVSQIRRLESQGVSKKDIAILFRSSFHILELELELNRARIPYAVRGGMRFFEQAHVKDILAYLRLVSNPADGVSWRRVLKMRDGIGEKTLDFIWRELESRPSFAEQVMILSELGVSTKAKQSLLEVQDLLGLFLGGTALPLRESILGILEKFYRTYLQANFENFKERVADLEGLLEFASQYQTWDLFLADTALSEKFDKEESGGDHLILSTIHQSKGLEWKAVFILALADGSFPHFRSFDNQEELEEERRLFYVACTRAKDHLYCMVPQMSMTNGELRVNQPSVFVKEVDSGLFKKEGTSAGSSYLDRLNIDSGFRPSGSGFGVGGSGSSLYRSKGRADEMYDSSGDGYEEPFLKVGDDRISASRETALERAARKSKSRGVFWDSLKKS